VNAGSQDWHGPPRIGPAWFRRWWFDSEDDENSEDSENGGDAADRVERLLLLAFGLVRAATLLELSVAAGLAWGSFRYGPAVAAVIGASAVESVAVIEAGRRRGCLGGTGVVALDAGITAAGVVVALVALRPSANPYLDNVYYPYSVASMALAGLTLRRLPGVVAVPAVVSAVYAAATVLRFDFRVGLLMNIATYWVFPLVAWALAQTVRWLGRQVDAAHGREVQLIRERESARHAEELHHAQLAAARAETQRLRERAETFTQLHNHVLQDLEFLARERVVGDERLQHRIGADAAWLRALLEDAAIGGPGNLVTALADVALQQEKDGLRVERNTADIADMSDGLLAPETVRALTDAVYEALTNVREHAGVSRAFVHALRADDSVTVTVVDQGRGFDAEQATGGYGIRSVIGERVRQVGGCANITSGVGDGTRVELTVPLRPAVPASALARPVNRGHDARPPRG
jgi:signal transduction histidine kinase